MTFGFALRSACLALAAIGLFPGCTEEPPATGAGSDSGAIGFAQSIEAILARDAELGAIRNRSSESASLADGINDYVAALDRLDFSACPADFAQAFRQHRNAWADSAGFFARFSERRGELHEVWLSIEQGDQGQEMLAVVRPIRDTWVAVEAAARRHGAMSRD